MAGVKFLHLPILHSVFLGFYHTYWIVTIGQGEDKGCSRARHLRVE